MHACVAYVLAINASQVQNLCVVLIYNMRE